MEKIKPSLVYPLVGKVNNIAERKVMNTWGSIYQKALDRGYDHGYAANLANAWERKSKTVSSPQPSLTQTETDNL